MDPTSNRINQLTNQINCEKKGAIICASIATAAAITAAVALALFLTVPVTAAIAPFVAIAAGGAALALLITAVSLVVAHNFKSTELNRLIIHGSNPVVILGRMDPELKTYIDSLKGTLFYQYSDEISDSALKLKFAISKDVQSAIDTDENIRFLLDLLSDDRVIDVSKLSTDDQNYFNLFRSMVRGDTESHLAQIFTESTHLRALGLWKRCKVA